ERYSDWGRVIGRLKPSVTLDQAQADMSAIGKHLEQQYPPSRTDEFAGFQVNLVPLAIQITGKELPLTLWVLFGAVWFVLTLAGVLFGLAPALRLSRGSTTLNCRSASITRESVRARSVLVIAQFALSSMLLCSAGLLIRSLVLVEAVQPGFHPERVLTMRIAA